MKKIVNASHILINLFLLIAAILLSFKGFPYALVSYAGYFLVMTAVGTIFGVWINPGKEHKQVLTKITTTVIGIVLVLAGEWVISKGGLLSINIGDPEGGNGVKIVFSYFAWLTGFLAALSGTHKKSEEEDILPSEESTLDSKIEYLLQLRAQTLKTESSTNIFSTFLAVCSIIAPIYLSIQNTNPWQLLLLLLFPLCYMSMGFAINGGGFFTYLPSIVISILLISLSSPWWYWIIGLGLCVAYYLTIVEIPILKRKESDLFDMWGIKAAVERRKREEENS